VGRVAAANAAWKLIMKTTRNQTGKPINHAPKQSIVQPQKLLSPFVVYDTDTLKTALLAIEKNELRTVIVTNKGNIVVGVLSDGDARASLLDGRLLSTPIHRVMNTDFLAVGPKERLKAKAILAQGHIFIIPVVDAQGELLDVLKSSDTL